MKGFELSFKSSWLYKYKKIEDIMLNENVSYINNYQGVDFFRVTRTYIENKCNLDDIKNALDNGDNNKAIELINSIKEECVGEDYCQLLLFRQLGLVIIVTNKISNWTDFIRQCKLQKIKYTDKKLIFDLTNSKFTENILNVTYDYKKSGNMINAINIYGSRIQNSNEFDDVIKDMEKQIVNITFQPQKYNFLVTLNGNKLQVSKYALNQEYLSFLIEFVYYIKENEGTYDYQIRE